MIGRHTGHFSPSQETGLLSNTTTPTIATLLRTAGYDTALIGKYVLNHHLYAPTAKPVSLLRCLYMILADFGSHRWGLDGNFPIPKAPGPGFPLSQGFDMFYGQSGDDGLA